jgi:hypothetical protein
MYRRTETTIVAILEHTGDGYAKREGRSARFRLGMTGGGDIKT